MLKRLGLFFAVNIAFMATISLFFFGLSLLFPNFTSSLLSNSRDNSQILSIFIYSGIVGFISAFMTLFLSKPLAKWSHGVTLIKKGEYGNHKVQFAYEKVEQLASQIGIKMPDVGVYDDGSVNAFATGWSKNHSLVALSEGLLNSMNEDEIEGVIAHEMAHIQNGDMVTLTLVQGVVNTLVLTASRLIANAVSQISDNEWVYQLTYIVAQIALGVLAIPIVAYFSRIREFKADSGASIMVGKDKMIAALQKLNQIHCPNPSKNQYAMINNSSESLFASHPSLDKRIQALRDM